MDYYNEGMILWREITTDCKETIVVCNGFGTGDVGIIRIDKRQDTFSTSPSDWMKKKQNETK